MMIFFKIIFFISLLGILHTYLIYPVLLTLIAKFKSVEKLQKFDTYPSVEIVFAAYNEESVITDKIISSFNTHYPKDKLSLRIGSDNSSDNTDFIIQNFQKKYPNLFFKAFKQRTGKSGIINQLVSESKADFLILTDANIIFTPDTVLVLVQELQQNKNIGAVGGHIEYRKVEDKGISKPENTYLQIENNLKQAESLLFGAAMGLEGGCYIIRKKLFPNIPPLFFMEDFFVSLSVLKQNYKVLFTNKAICYEDVSVAGSEEFKRKVRISIGNFQNLNRFKWEIIKQPFTIGIPFISHKILRWLTPFFLILLLISTSILIKESAFYLYIAIFYYAFIALGLLGIVFSHSKKLSFIKYPGHFINMNFALLKGFIVYLKGVKSNVWQPTTRNQK